MGGGWRSPRDLEASSVTHVPLKWSFTELLQLGGAVEAATGQTFIHRPVMNVIITYYNALAARTSLKRNFFFCF